MKGIIRFFLDRTFVVNLLSVFIIIFGVISFLHTRRDLIPPIEVKSIVISASLYGASPQEIEKQITFPIEEAIKNISGIKQISSNSYDSYSSIHVNFKSDFKEMDRALENIKAKVRSIESNLPSEIEPIQVQQIKVDEVEVMSFAIDGVDEWNAKDRAWVSRFEDMLRSQLGVVRVSSSLHQQNVYISFYPQQLANYGLSISNIRERIQSTLTYLPVASFEKEGQAISIEMKGIYDDLDKIKMIPIIVTRSGQSVYLHQLAKVELKFPDVEKMNLLDGRRLTTVEVFKDLDSDIVTLSEQLRSISQDFIKIAPTHLKVTEINDTSRYLGQQLTVLKNNALMGTILVALILYFLLGARISLVTLMGLPFAYFGTFVVLSFFGVSIDLISVVGLILVVGVLVDDAIVVSEQYVQNLEQGMSARKAAYHAARETIVPVTGTIVTTMVAFASLLILSSEAAEILFAIPCVVIASLALSWFECYFVLPNHLQHFVKSKSKRTEGKFFKKILSVYKKILPYCLRWRYLLSGIIVVFLFLSFYIAAAHLEKSFSFSVGNEYLRINFALKQSESFDQTEEALKPIHQFLLSLPKENVERIYSQLGDVYRNSRELKGKRFGTIYVQLPQFLKDAKNVLKKLEVQVDEELKKLKGDQFEYLYVQSMVKGDEKKMDDVITIYISGRDRMPIQDLQAEMQKLLVKQNGILEVFIDQDKFIESWRFIPNQQELLRHGMGPGSVTLQLRDIFTPQELMTLRLDGENTTIFSQYHLASKPSLEQLGSFEIQSPQDISLPTRLLGKWEKLQILKEISHEDLLRKLEVDVRYDEKNMKKDQVAEKIDEMLKPMREKYPVLKFEVLSETRAEKENKEWLVKVALLAVGLIVFVLMLCLHSLVQPFIVASVIPFGVIGVIWALYIHSLPLGIMAVIGIVGMAGVVVNDSLVMVDAINRLQIKANDLRYSIVEGASSRLRPILMTTLTTLGGVFPMGYGLGGEVGFTRPLAFSMGWGLLFSTLLTLFFLPALLVILDDFKRLLSRPLIKIIKLMVEFLLSIPKR